MSKQVHNQWNRRRTDPAYDLKSLLMQIVVVTAEESSQQRHRTRALLDECGFSGRTDLRVVGHHAICPFAGRADGKM